MTFDYDPVADVLYVAFETPQAGPSVFYVENGQGDIIRIDESRHAILGCTLTSFFKRTNVNAIDVPEIGAVPYSPAQIPLFQPQEA